MTNWQLKYIEKKLSSEIVATWLHFFKYIFFSDARNGAASRSRVFTWWRLRHSVAEAAAGAATRWRGARPETGVAVEYPRASPFKWDTVRPAKSTPSTSWQPVSKIGQSGFAPSVPVSFSTLWLNRPRRRSTETTRFHNSQLIIHVGNDTVSRCLECEKIDCPLR